MGRKVQGTFLTGVLECARLCILRVFGGIGECMAFRFFSLGSYGLEYTFNDLFVLAYIQ